jgi:hypothetical protein
MSAIQPFNPAYLSGQVVTPAAGAASITINKEAKQVCLTNLGANVCYVRLSDVAISATTADYPVPPNGTQVVITKADGHSILSHISAAGTTLHVMTGEGL